MKGKNIGEIILTGGWGDPWLRLLSAWVLLVPVSLLWLFCPESISVDSWSRKPRGELSSHVTAAQSTNGLTSYSYSLIFNDQPSSWYEQYSHTSSTVLLEKARPSRTTNTVTSRYSAAVSSPQFVTIYRESVCRDIMCKVGNFHLQTFMDAKWRWCLIEWHCIRVSWPCTPPT